MIFTLILWLYRALLPIWLVASLPMWLVKMSRRGGWSRRLWERFGLYVDPPEFDPSGAVMVHAISVGEALLALKLIRAWKVREPHARFVLGVGTSTGFEVAERSAPEGVRVAYAPIDVPWAISAYFRRFEPSQLVLVEGEMWPHLLLACRKRSIPVALVNARLSPRSERRYRSLAPIVQPIFSMLSAVAAQEMADIERWASLGIETKRIHVTGSLKFDPGVMVTERPRREDFQGMVDAFGGQRPVILAASTHAGEEKWIGQVIRKSLPQALFLAVPRHAERRHEVRSDLISIGYEPILRSAFSPPGHADQACLIVDSTGEMQDWITLADFVIIGKSILGVGGQNPAEAIMAGKPVLFGPNMQNFEPLAGSLVHEKGAFRFAGQDELASILLKLLKNKDLRGDSIAFARRRLTVHSGATDRILDLLMRLADASSAQN
jgi:3-deoxy-D-manno-octulosonic-acid transferase